MSVACKGIAEGGRGGQGEAVRLALSEATILCNLTVCRFVPPFSVTLTKI